MDVTCQDALAVGTSSRRGWTGKLHLTRTRQQLRYVYRNRRRGELSCPCCPDPVIVGFSRGPMVKESPKKRKTAGWVYVVQWSSMPWHVKIGFSKSLKDRFASFLTASPDTLVVVKAFEANPEDEVDLHSRFQASRDVGEWFRLSPSLKTFLESEAVCQTLEAKVKFGRSYEDRIKWVPMRPRLEEVLQALHQEKRLPRFVKSARAYVLWALNDLEVCDYFATSNAIIHHEANREAYQAKTIYNQLISLEDEGLVEKKPGKIFTLSPKGFAELSKLEDDFAMKRKSARSLRLD